MTSLIRLTAAAILGGAIVLGTGSCALLPPGAVVETLTPAATPTPTDTPTEEPAPVVDITCESVVEPATLAEWAGLGIEQNIDFADKMHDENNVVLSLFDDNGGIVCQWGQPAGSATMIYGYSKISYDQLIEQQNRLGGLGADVSAYAGSAEANLYSLEFGEFIDGGPEYYLFTGDLSDPDDLWWMYAYTTDMLDELVANIPDL